MVKAPSRVAILILNYNGEDHLDACLQSIEAMTFPSERLDIVVADNASTDASLRICADRYPWARIIEHGENLGFSAGNTKAVEALDHDYVAFLNNDTRVDPGWLEPLVQCLDDHDDVVCAGSRVLDFEGERVLFAGSSMHFSGFGYQTGMGDPLDKHPGDAPAQETLFATGCAMLVRRKTYLETGGFDPEFFAYYEDVDLGWRWHVLGYRTMYVPSSVIYHKESASFKLSPTDRKQLLWNRNVLCAMFKNYEDEHLRKLLPVALLLTIERGMFFLEVSGEEATARVLSYFPDLESEVAHERRREVGIAHLRAVQEFVDRLPSMIEKRAKIQNRRRRSDADLFARFPVEIDYRDQVNEAVTRSALCRLAPMLDVADLWNADRLDAPLMTQMRKLEDAVLAYRERVDQLTSEIEARGEAIEEWRDQTLTLNEEITRLAPLEEELINIKSKRWYKAIMALRRLRGKGEPNG